MIIWWNFIYKVDDSSQVTEKRSPIVTVPDNVIEVQPIHFIQLTVKAQIYALIIGPNWICFGQNDFIMSFYKVQHQVKVSEDEVES